MKITNKDYFIFSGGEVHYNKLLDDEINRIICLDYTMNGFMAICQIKEYFKRTGLFTHLIYPYFPYARQDRFFGGMEPFSLKIFAELLNSRNFDKITIWDPHSDVTPALINNCEIIPQWEIARQIIPFEYFDNPDVMFVSPDAGAYKKLSKLITNDYRIAIGTKIRSSTGEIIKTNLYSPVDLKDKTCVIVDDICDGGKTFIELGKELKRKGAAKVVLYVTHGIFSKGFEELEKYIGEIYTTNSFPNVENKILKIVEVSC